MVQEAKAAGETLTPLDLVPMPVLKRQVEHFIVGTVSCILEIVHKRLGINSLTKADELNRELEFFADWQNDSAFCRAVQFREHNACAAGRITESLSLTDCILASCGIEYE